MSTRSDPRTVLITGGAGFVGSNLAADFLADGWRVRVLDDLSRSGVRRNLDALQRHHPKQVELYTLDVAAAGALDGVLEGVEAVYHLAAQVAVTTSLERPALDFRTNLLGTFRLLEAVRRRPCPPPFVFASTNKVYGNLDDVPLREDDQRYVSLAQPAVDESRPLDFHTPYGCSKGAAEQYVLDYARCFGVPATALRMSCIYGPQQYGTTDQGWVAHFLRQVLHGRPIEIYGNGKQVRDILFVGDLVAAQRAALRHMPRLAGAAWNVGGGVANSVSLLEVLDLIARIHGRPASVRFHPPRVGDQLFYVSDHSAFTAVTAWQPQIAPAEGVRRLHDWLAEHDAPPRPVAAAAHRAMGA